MGLMFGFFKKEKTEKIQPIEIFVGDNRQCAPWHRNYISIPHNKKEYELWKEKHYDDWSKSRDIYLPYKYYADWSKTKDIWDTNDWVKDNLSGLWSYGDDPMAGVRYFDFELEIDLALFKLWWN